ncbi:MAG TPA: ATP-binding cassette domain-containing protein [Mycobacterium sp.]|nr:ATP-binding cassette domain-containing protein [Mycobacterium sp.]
MTATVPAPHATTPVADDVAIRIRDGSAVLEGRTVWSHVNLDVAAGEFVSVLGPNGSGKTTLLNVILGLTPARGKIVVLGAAPGRRNRRIGYVPQRRAFSAGLRIRGVDVVAMGLDGARWGTPIPGLSRILWPRRFAERQDRLEEVITLVGAAGYAERPIGECSGGEQQRLLIAQALIRRPKLLLLDEPLESLDMPSQAGISALVRDICRRERVAVVLVAHDVNPILPYLDRVLYLAGGGAVSGTPRRSSPTSSSPPSTASPVDVLRDRFGRLVVVGQPDVPAGHPSEGSR